MFNEDFSETVIDNGAQRKIQYMQRGIGDLKVRVVAPGERRCEGEKIGVRRASQSASFVCAIDLRGRRS